MEHDPREELRRAVHGDENESLRSAERPAMLDIRPSRGGWLALPYMTLRQVEFNPDGRPQLRIEFSSHVVEVVGRDLEGLYLAVVGQRASVISEVQGLYVDEERAGPVVERLTIRKKERRNQEGEAFPPEM